MIRRRVGLGIGWHAWAARLRQLAEDRRRLGEFQSWLDADSAALLAERARLRGATWDALLELRHALEERERVLAEVEQRLLQRYDEADQRHDEAVAAAERRLGKSDDGFNEPSQSRRAVTSPNSSRMTSWSRMRRSD